MVQLVFVHGVATRSGPGYEKSLANRDILFTKVSFANSKVSVRSPLWGDIVPAIDSKVFQTDEGVRSFALGGYGSRPISAGIGQAATANVGSLTDVARQSAVVALDAVFIELLAEAERTRTTLTAAEIAAFQKAVDAIDQHNALDTLKRARSETEFVKLLNGEGALSFGIASTIAQAAAAVTNRVRNIASTIAFGAIRDVASPAIAFFLGDVFAYLREGDLRARIRQVIRADLLEAHAASKSGGGPVVVVAHSMGGVIAVDMLQDIADAGLPPDLSIAALFTVGSQPGLFKAVGGLAGKSGADGRALRPESVKAWFNVFDPIDPLAFRADPTFSGVEDLVFDSITGLATAHTSYFARPQFFARFRKRVTDLGIH